MNDNTTTTTTAAPKEGTATMDELAGLLVTAPSQKGNNTVTKPIATQQVGDEEDPLPGEGTNAADDVDWNSPDDISGQQSNEPAANEGDEGNEEDEEGHEGKDNEPFYTVKIGDKSERVPLSEALKGYQRQRDYTQKTQEVATLRQQAEAEHTAAKTARAQYDQQLATLLGALGEEANDPKAEDWERLKAEAPEQYAVEYADYQRRLDARGKVRQERQRVTALQQEETLKAIQTLAGQEREKLLENFPAWKDPEKYKVGAKSIFDFASKQYGFSTQELNNTIDHRIIRMAEDARRYRGLVAKQVSAKQKLNDAPVVEPKGRTPQPTRKQVVQKEARARAVRTGKVDDVSLLIMS